MVLVLYFKLGGQDLNLVDPYFLFVFLFFLLAHPKYRSWVRHRLRYILINMF
jgi:hypothetical protein